MLAQVDLLAEAFQFKEFLTTTAGTAAGASLGGGRDGKRRQQTDGESDATTDPGAEGTWRVRRQAGHAAGGRGNVVGGDVRREGERKC
ncbi:hypothetical protein LzC2_17990 [Planctomycetes bacterium LzC2]|uniref:Uncharacterized protein n=1 Tax=Alienimonas chondri TaxID=2681879 RepID=A0ABX1VFA1_9PLAN|nr:hypothetical protein [Alienimonas chondri]